jgi:hypothetical protein
MQGLSIGGARLEPAAPSLSTWRLPSRPFPPGGPSRLGCAGSPPALPGNRRRSGFPPQAPRPACHARGPRSEPGRASPMSVPASRQGYGASQPRSNSFYVLRTDNKPRVRDGYISKSTLGHARAMPTHHELPACRTNVLVNARACTRVPPQSLHGKEGVDGSSPSEGFRKGQQMAFLLPLNDTTRPRPNRNLSPRLVPNVRARASSWHEHRDRRP